MKNKKIWKNIFDKYQKIGLNSKPSIFAKESIKFFNGRITLLDLGAGLGQDSKFFANEGFDVTCTDVSDYALSIAKKEINNKTVKFKKVDLSKELPFKNGSFDIVYSHLSSHYFDKKTTEKLFKEIHRILKPKGIFASLFNTINDPEIKKSYFKKIEKNYYQEGDGLKKRYFCVKCLKEFTDGLFKTIIADNRGKSHKDKIKCLIRFVGEKK